MFAFLRLRQTLRAVLLLVVVLGAGASARPAGQALAQPPAPAAASTPEHAQDPEFARLVREWTTV